MFEEFRKGVTKPSKNKLQKYQAAASDWEKDVLKSIVRERTIAWLAFGFMCAVAGAEAVAIYTLAPMKEKVPYLLRVDNSTGIVDEMVTLFDEKTLAADEQLTRYWIKKYIDARESYEYKFANDNYQTVYLMSESKLAVAYKESYLHDSPVKKYGNSQTIKIKIKTFEVDTDEKNAVVRILSEKHREGEKPIIKHFLIRLGYDYLNGQKLPQSIRDKTPLGFVVTSYSITEENYQ